jgi:glutathione peroxidase-family protein
MNLSSILIIVSVLFRYVISFKALNKQQINLKHITSIQKNLLIKKKEKTNQAASIKYSLCKTLIEKNTDGNDPEVLKLIQSLKDDRDEIDPKSFLKLFNGVWNQLSFPDFPGLHLFH